MSANDFLMGGGVPSAKFPALGTIVGGRITRVGEPVQQRDFATGSPKFWDDGSPMMQLPVEVATDLRDPDIDDDDGSRCFYVKGQMRKAIADAVRSTGSKGLEVGGTLTVTYARDGEASKKGFNPPKEYEATYVAPVAGSGFLGTEAAAAAAAPAVTGGTQVASPVAPAQPDPQVLAAAVANLTPEQRAAIGLPAA